MMVNRGTPRDRRGVRIPPDNKLSGNVVDLCPVGRCATSFLYRQRVWFMPSVSVCPHCATGCSILIDENQDRIYRIRPRENPHVNKWWICNDGRYGYPHVHSDRRLLVPQRRDKTAQGQGAAAPVDWTSLVGELRQRLTKAGRLAALLSPFLTVEGLHAGQVGARLDPQAGLGADPNRRNGRTVPQRIPISAEKCPNRRGVERCWPISCGIMGFEEFLSELDGGQIRGVGFRRLRARRIDEANAQRFGGWTRSWCRTCSPSPLSQRADYVLPSAAFAERDGSYVNRRDHLQSMRAAIRRRAECEAKEACSGNSWQCRGCTTHEPFSVKRCRDGLFRGGRRHDPGRGNPVEVERWLADRYV